MNYFFNILYQKSILRLAFVVCCPLIWAGTCQTTPMPSNGHGNSTDTLGLEMALPSTEEESDTSKVRIYSKEELLGQFDPAKHPDFVPIQRAHTGKAGIYMQAAAYDAFVRMHLAAKREGVSITIISATRNFAYQKGIWEKKWLREKYKGWNERDKVADILKYSSMPGTSRHHWGTDVDFNSVELNYWRSGAGAQLYTWLAAHAAEYGFYQTYTKKDEGRTGYEEEQWHWSYMPLASAMHQQYRATIRYSDITGFSGSKEAEALKVFETYVDGIAAEWKP